MTMSRREVIKMGLAAGTALSIPSTLRAKTAPGAAQPVHMVIGGFLSIFDPMFTTTNPTAYHGLAVFDTLFSLNSKGIPQPQMVGNFAISDDKKTYTFELRDGLNFHDDSPVTAADCVASIRRWGQVHPGGQLLMERATDISSKDDKTFTITLKEPLGSLLDILATTSAPLPFIMRESDAKRPATEQVTSSIGSGPFKFNQDLAKPGASFAYDKNEKYVPRSEPADGYAGGKVVNVDRVIWDNIADPQTAFAALQSGEIDFVEAPPPDMLPVIESDPNLKLKVLNKSGDVYFMRLNSLQKPFDNVKARQAMLHLIDQEAFLRVMSPDPQYARTITSLFGNTTPYSNDENTGWFKKGGDPEKAKQLFNEAGYAGEKVVVLQATDVQRFNDAALLVATALQKIGINAELAPSDWGGIGKRRTNKGPVDERGWSIFISSWDDFSIGDPLFSSFVLANGDKAWYGWPKNDEFEALRNSWADVGSLEQRQALARKMQAVWWNFVGAVFLGETISPVAHRKALTNLLEVPSGLLCMWNMQKV
ncbi:ABC transporter substrate-binding protein [Rhizobium mayense]|uniref:ABC transporter substrate-binding protein n=1 Tax=Rhizobium mayense TaxID=1312184 RepID=A0ABT7K3W7_9HYPH|nr:ABC transporter substrate-binding protein [Rhizobium mayense]MDL2403305.1 ABC transporter substrate-binding protein [Rhizobium mayense]